MKTTILTSVFAFATAFAPFAVKADDAEWGCQILLCAASSAPSWHGVPYCVPPMKKLITEMAKPGFSWPTCSAAGTGKPSYEQYYDCPAGMIVGYKVVEKRDTTDAKPSLCAYPQNDCTEKSCNNPAVAIERAVRTDPYYFDIKNNAGSIQRFYFNLTE